MLKNKQLKFYIIGGLLIIILPLVMPLFTHHQNTGFSLISTNSPLNSIDSPELTKGRVLKQNIDLPEVTKNHPFYIGVYLATKERNNRGTLVITLQQHKNRDIKNFNMSKIKDNQCLQLYYRNGIFMPGEATLTLESPDGILGNSISAWLSNDIPRYPVQLDGTYLNRGLVIAFSVPSFTQQIWIKKILKALLFMIVISALYIGIVAFIFKYKKYFLTVYQFMLNNYDLSFYGIMIVLAVLFVGVVLFQHFLVDYNKVSFINVMNPNPKVWVNTGEIVKHGLIAQKFILPQEIEKSVFYIDIFMANKLRYNIGNLIISLRQNDNIYQKTFAAEKIKDNRYHRFTVDSKNFKSGEAVLELKSDNCWPGNAVVAWLTDDIPAEVAIINDKLHSKGLAIRISTPVQNNWDCIIRVTKGSFQRIVFILSYLATILVVYWSFFKQHPRSAKIRV